MGTANLLGGILRGVSSAYLTQKDRMRAEEAANEKRDIEIWQKLAGSDDPETRAYGERRLQETIEKGLPKAQRGIFQQVTQGFGQPARQPMDERLPDGTTPTQAVMAQRTQPPPELPPTHAGGPQPNPNMQPPAPAAPMPPSLTPDQQAMSLVDQIVSQSGYTEPGALRVVRQGLLNKLAERRFQQMFAPRAVTPPPKPGANLMEVGQNLYDPETKQWITPPARPDAPATKSGLITVDGQLYDPATQTWITPPAKPNGSGGMSDYQRESLRIREQEAADRKARAAEAAAAKTDAKLATDQQKVDSIVDNLQRMVDMAHKLRQHPGLAGATGTWHYSGIIPGSDAATFETQLESLKAQIGFNTLQAMREASRTGGALGNVSDRDIALLTAVLGSLEGRQSEESMRQVLQDIENYAKAAQVRVRSSISGPTGPPPAAPVAKPASQGKTRPPLSSFER